MASPSIVVLAIDGLRASALGAYGNTWYSTPALDRLASESLLFDQFYADSHPLPSIYKSLWSGQLPGEASSESTLGLAERLSRQGYETLLVTDDDSLREHPHAEEFSRVAPVPQPDVATMADSPAEISSAETLAMLLDQLEQCAADRPVLAWAHLRFASGPWDAPLRLAESLLDEEDPTPEARLESPTGVSEEEGSEFAFQSTVRYAAQVIALDHCLGVVSSALDEVLGKNEYQLAVLGLRGFALGEHGRVGIEDDRPYSEMRQVPLLIRPAGDRQHRRQSRLLTSSSFPGILLGDAPALITEPEAIVLNSPSGSALQDDAWRLIAPLNAPAELYSKPDDRWEMNDVAIRRPHVVEEMQQWLKDRKE